MRNVNPKIAGLIFGIFLVLFLFAVSYLQAQDTRLLMKLQLAQRLEDSDEWEQAVKIYEELYLLEPNNFVVISGLQRGYTQIKEYEKAVNVIRKWLVFQPHDINMAAALGELYYDSGNEKAADSVWNSILAHEPQNVQAYRTVANELTEHRLYEKSVRIYIDGRTKIKNETLFADELGTLYAALQQYASAAGEYVRLVKNAPEQLYFVQSRLSSFISKPEALSPALDIVRTEVRGLPESTGLHRLYTWLLMEDKKYQAALDEYRIIDRLASANGNELFNFAQRLGREHLPALAAEAFKEILGADKNKQLVPQAKFGYARAMEELNDRPDRSASQAEYLDVIRLYESIVTSYPNSDLAAQALLRIGIVRCEKLFDLNGAVESFKQAAIIRPSSNYAYESWLKIGEVQTALNELDKARGEYEKLRSVPLSQYQYQGEFRLAELDYFEAKFDSALSILKRFNTNLNTDLANDALQLQYFIQENMTSSLQALVKFAEADLLMRRCRYSESIVLFRDIIKNNPQALLIDDAMMKTGELCLHLNQPEEAIKAFRFIVDSVQISILKDRSMFRIAETYQTILGKKELAMEAYEGLITKFPNSLYAEECRKRIRLLRGDSI